MKLSELLLQIIVYLQIREIFRYALKIFKAKNQKKIKQLQVTHGGMRKTRYIMTRVIAMRLFLCILSDKECSLAV